MNPLDPILTPDRLLSLVLEPEEASAVVGDLMEERSRRGRLWFWTQLIETFAVAVAQELIREPWTLVKAGAMSLWHMTGSFVISLIVMVAVDACEIPHYLRHPHQLWGFKPFLMAAFILPGLMGGLSSALKAPGRELAVAIVSNLVAVPLFFSVFILLCSGLGTALDFAWPQGIHLSSLPSMLAQVSVCFVLGAFVGRSFRLSNKPPTMNSDRSSVAP